MRNDLIARTMSRRRFEKLSSALVCNDPANMPDAMPSETREVKEAIKAFKRANPVYPSGCVERSATLMSTDV